MPIWPFRKRRRSAVKDSAAQPFVSSEKAQPDEPDPPPTSAATYPSAAPTLPIPIPRRSSKRNVPMANGKENVPPALRPTTSREDITALPMSWKLEHSPHLRPVDMDRPHIPYNFRSYSTSQTNVPGRDSVESPRSPNKLRSRRSGYASSTPQRGQSSKKRKEDDHVREEEIRAMSAQSPLPKRPGGFSDGPLRRDSKKIRGLGLKDTEISVPQEESIHESMYSIVEHRGWEIGMLDVFNPRPAVRLSDTPHYVTPGSMANIATESPEPLKKGKEKLPLSRGSGKKREVIGSRADNLDASDLRMVMERDAKRRELRRQEQQEKLERKLRSRNGRNRAYSDQKALEAEGGRKVEEAKLQADEERRERNLMTPPAAVHPALRGDLEEPQDAVGLGIGENEAAAVAVATGAVAIGVLSAEDDKDHKMENAEEQTKNPFADPEPEQWAAPASDRATGALTPMEEPVLGTAREVRLSQTSTPPLSPMQSARATSSLSQVMDTPRSSQVPSPAPVVANRRASQPIPERRTGAWATFFRRGTNSKRSADPQPAMSDASFSNASRESMRNQPLPPHLVDTQVRPTSQVRSTSGSTPVRTQSKFREDLPEMPISPPDSRMASPDVTTAASAAAAAAVARRAQISPQPADAPRQSSTAGSENTAPGRNDTPISPSLRMMSTSMASVDSEGEWLASGSAKRHSKESGLSRIGSLGQRKPEFSASYEELGIDKDSEHFSRGTPTPETRRKKSASALAGASEQEENEFFDGQQGESEVDPTVHESVQRQPTLVHRDPRVRSTEGLLTEYEGAEAEPEPASAVSAAGKSSIDMDEAALERATSVDYGKGHARQISAGSAKLFDIQSRRESAEQSGNPAGSSSKL